MHLPGPATIVNPNERLLKSDPPDISRPRARAMARGTGRGGERAKAPSSQLQFVFALKRNITWWDRVEDSADASCVVRRITPSRTVSRIVRYRFDWRQHSKGVPLKSRLPP